MRKDLFKRPSFESLSVRLPEKDKNRLALLRERLAPGQVAEHPRRERPMEHRDILQEPVPIYPPAPGEIYQISNGYWHIREDLGFRHPGAVLSLRTSFREMLASLGTDARNVPEGKRSRLYVVVHPDANNGLKLSTAFLRKSREITTLAAEFDRRLGQLSGNDLNRLRTACGLSC